MAGSTGLLSATRTPTVLGFSNWSLAANLTSWSVYPSQLYFAPDGVALPNYLRYYKVRVVNSGSITLYAAFDDEQNLVAPAFAGVLATGAPIYPGETRDFDVSTLMGAVGVRRLRMKAISPFANFGGTDVADDANAGFALESSFYTVHQSS